MHPADERGMHVALLGIDGIGKSTLAAELAELCRDRGRPVSVVSWRSYIDQPSTGATGYPLESLRNLYVETFRLFCAGAVIDGGVGAFPTTYAEFAARGGGAGLDGTSFADVRPSGPVAAVLLEASGNLIFQREVVQPLVARGHVVIEESYGYKHVVKDLIYAAHAAPGATEELALITPFAREFFGRVLQPDVGLYVCGDPALAMRWRTAQSGAPGRFEALPDAERPEALSFIDMQAACAGEFERFAEENAWVHVLQVDAPRSKNRERVLAVVQGTPLGDLLSRSGSAVDGGTWA